MAPIYKNSNTILAPTYKSPIIFRQLLTKSPNTILTTIYKSSILFWQLLTKAQYYLGNYLQKPNFILATTYKNSILSWQVFTKAQYYFGTFYQKTQNYWANNYSTKAQILFGKNNYIMLKAQNYSLAKTYFHILKSITHGKLNYLWYCERLH